MPTSSFLKKALLHVFLYLFIYCPPFIFLPVNISLILSVFCIFLFYIKSFPRVIYYFKNELFLFFLIFLYSLIVSMFYGEIVLYDPFIILFFNIPVVFLIYYIVKDAYGGESNIYNKFVDILINIAIISSLISIFLWFNKDLNVILKFVVLKYSEELLVYQNHRGYGLADELLFSYSIVQACIFLLAVERFGLNLKTIILFLLVFFSISLNARIGFLFLSFLVFIPRNLKKSSLKWILLLFLILFLLLLSFSSSEFVTFSLDQLLYFYDDFSGGTNQGTFDVLLNQMLVFPNDAVSYLFGTGENIFLNNKISSDIGYIILFFYGGLFYLILIFCFFAYCYFQGLKLKKSVPINIIILMVLVANIKGLFFAAKPGMHLFLCVYFIMLISHYEAIFLKNRRSHH